MIPYINLSILSNFSYIIDIINDMLQKLWILVFQLYFSKKILFYFKSKQLNLLNSDCTIMSLEVTDGSQIQFFSCSLLYLRLSVAAIDYSQFMCELKSLPSCQLQLSQYLSSASSCQQEQPVCWSSNQVMGWILRPVLKLKHVDSCLVTT